MRLFALPASGNGDRAETVVRDLAPTPTAPLDRHPEYRRLVSIVGIRRAVLFIRKALAVRRAAAPTRPMNPDRIWKD